MNATEEVECPMPDRDTEGYLVDPADWNECVARQLASEEDISLGEDHWDVIHFMRSYYDEHQLAADARFVIRHMETRMGKSARKILFELFPYGHVKQTCKISGMKRPRAWSTG